MTAQALSYEDLKKPRADEVAGRDALAAAIGASGIPRRFREARIGAYKSTSREQDAAVRVILQYGEQFRERRRDGSCLVLAGKVGTGKTMLACAIGLAVLQHGYTVQYATVSRVIRTIRRAYSDRTVSEEEAIQDYVQPDLLILDEIGKQRGTEDERMLLFEVLNDRYNYPKPTIVVSNEGREGLIEYLGEPLFDRLRENGGVFVPFTWSSYR